MLPFSQMLLKQDISNFDYSLVHGQHFYCRVDDLDFVSVSQVCQKFKLQIVLFRFLFGFLSTVV